VGFAAIVKIEYAEKMTIVATITIFETGRAQEAESAYVLAEQVGFAESAEQVADLLKGALCHES
jgi:hypothetical protein